MSASNRSGEAVKNVLGILAMNGRRNMDHHVQEGQIWHERDRRTDRFVKVLMLLRPDGLRIRTCDRDGSFKRGSRESEVDAKRFVKTFDLVT
jgi:hypothetical protein